MYTYKNSSIDKNIFCYVCGKYYGTKRHYVISGNETLQTAYECYFNLKLAHDVERQ